MGRESPTLIVFLFEESEPMSTEGFFERYIQEHPEKFPKIDANNRVGQPGDLNFKEFVESLSFGNGPKDSPATRKQEE
jgi:hypothetical protein